MHPLTQRVWDRVMTALPGWLLLVGGLALVGLAVLTPEWLAVREQAWRREVMAAQAEALGEQRARYERFELALKRDDPVVLERLAFAQLGLKPVGKTPVMPPAAVPLRVGGEHRFVSAAAGPARAIPLAGSVDQWLAKPVPRVGRELRAYRAPDTRLTRLATGGSRFFMLAAGLACVVAALWPGMWGNGTPGEAEEQAGAGAASPHR